MVSVLVSVVLWLACPPMWYYGERARLCGIMVNVLAYVVLWLTCSPMWYYG
jgi:low affinity Fe/Cu permease